MKHLRSPSIALLSACDRLFDRLFDRPSIAFDHPYFYPPITLGGSKPRFRPWAAERGSARRESEEAKLRPSRPFIGDSPMTVSLSLNGWNTTTQHCHHGTVASVATVTIAISSLDRNHARRSPSPPSPRHHPSPRLSGRSISIAWAASSPMVTIPERSPSRSAA